MKQIKEENSNNPNSLQTFLFEGKKVRVIKDEKGQILFVATDVCSILEYKNLSDVLGRLNADGVVSNYPIPDNLGRPQPTNMLTEAGLESLILGSRKAVAKEFGAWVSTHIIAILRNIFIQNAEFQLFAFENLLIRILIDKQGRLWFVATDICKALDYTKSTSSVVQQHCNAEGCTKMVHPLTKNEQEVILINEGNLYRLVIKSTKKEAQNFERWVFDEILPTLRKTGKYQMPAKIKEEEEAEDLAAAVLQEQDTYRAVQAYMERAFGAMLRDAIKNEVLPFLQKMEEKMAIMEKKQAQIDLDIAILKKAIPLLNPAAPLLQPSYVYLAYQHFSGLHKIGKADEPLTRIFQLEAGGGEITLITTIRFSSPALALMWENTLHQTFADYHVEREWFQLTEYHVKAIQNLAKSLDGLF